MLRIHKTSNLDKTDALVTYLIYILTNKGIQPLYKNIEYSIF